MLPPKFLPSGGLAALPEAAGVVVTQGLRALCLPLGACCSALETSPAAEGSVG